MGYRRAEEILPMDVMYDESITEEGADDYETNHKKLSGQRKPEAQLQ